MTTATSTPTGISATGQPGAGRIILVTGLICGTMDISAAFISAGLMNDVNPLQVLRYVAAALLGPDVRANGGLGAAAFGLALHFAIATSWSALFYKLSRQWSVLTRQPVLWGLIYGTFVYLFMNLAAVPFALWFRSLYLHTPVTYAPRLAWLQYVIILGCIGLPIAFSVRWLDRQAGAASAKTA